MKWTVTSCCLAMLMASHSPSAMAQAKASPKASATAADPAIEDNFWSRISHSKDAADYELYLKEYPNGRYVPLAQLELGRLQRGAAAPAPAAAPARLKLVQDPEFPIVAPMLEKLSGDPKFAAPNHAAARPIQLAGVLHIAQKNGSTIDQEMRQSMVRVPNTPFCKGTMSMRWEMRDLFEELDSRFLSWMGLAPLIWHDKVQHRWKNAPPTGSEDPTQYRIDGLTAAPFPLTPGKHFEFDWVQIFIKNASTPPQDLGTHISCDVRDSINASRINPEWSGRVTPLACTVEEVPGISMYYWVEDAGCFFPELPKERE